MEQYKPLIPMAYLVIAALIAIACHLLSVPAGVSGLLVGAAITRVKMPHEKPMEPEAKPGLNI